MIQFIGSGHYSFTSKNDFMEAIWILSEIFLR